MILQIDGDLVIDGQIEVPSMGSTGLGTDVIWWLGGLYKFSSSAKYKDNIQPLRDDFYKILHTDPKSFTCRTTGQRGIGFIAEEFDNLGLGNLVVYDEHGEPDSIQYKLISVYLIEVLKDQVEATKQLREKHELLEDRIEALERTIHQLTEGKMIEP
jgi:hypothetical protein